MKVLLSTDTAGGVSATRRKHRRARPRRAQRCAAELSIQRTAHAYRRLYEQLVATREAAYA